MVSANSTASTIGALTTSATTTLRPRTGLTSSLMSEESQPFQQSISTNTSTENESYYNNAMRLKKFPYPFTFQSLASFTGLLLIITYSTALAIYSLLPSKTYMLPLIIFFPSMVTYCFYRTLTSPQLLNEYYTEVSKHNGQINEQAQKCEKCNRIRLERTHHCSKCEICIPKMSHHCGVLGVCLGQHNLKSFCLGLIYAFVGSFILCLFIVPRAVSLLLQLLYHRQIQIRLHHILQLYVTYLQFVITALVLFLSLYHGRLIATNHTVLEAIAGRQLWNIVLPFRSYVPSTYSLSSASENFKQVFEDGECQTTFASRIQLFIPSVNFKHNIQIALSQWQYANNKA